MNRKAKKWRVLESLEVLKRRFSPSLKNYCRVWQHANGFLRLKLETVSVDQRIIKNWALQRYCEEAGTGNFETWDFAWKINEGA